MEEKEGPRWKATVSWFKPDDPLTFYVHIQDIKELDELINIIEEGPYWHITPTITVELNYLL